MKANEQEKIKLKPCPFCGSKKAYPIQGFTMFLIHCPKCEATVSFMNKKEKENLIEAWNTRVKEEVK